MKGKSADSFLEEVKAFKSCQHGGLLLYRNHISPPASPERKCWIILTTLNEASARIIHTIALAKSYVGNLGGSTVQATQKKTIT